MTWDVAKDEFLKKHYNKDLNIKDIALYLHTSKSSVTRRANQLGLTKPRRKLTDEMVDYILTNVKTESVNSMAERFEVEAKTIRNVLQTHVVENPRSVYSTPTKWTNEEVEFLKVNYRNFSLCELADMLGRTAKSVEKKALNLKLGRKGIPSSSTSKNEIRFANLLYEMGLDYQRESDLGNQFYADFYLPEYHLIIELQGSYWHPVNEPANPIQERTAEKDQRKKDHILSLGYNLLYVRDTQLKNLQECKKYILRNLPPNPVNCGESCE